MKHIGLKLLLFIEMTFVLERSAAADSMDRNASALPQNSSALVTNVAQLRSLSRSDFNRGRPVSFTGIVTLVDNDRSRIVLQDSTGAVMWHSDHPVDSSLVGKMLRIDCADAYPYATAFPEFPCFPSRTEIQTSFEAPPNWGDYHLTRMAGYLRPPRSGEYRFWIASDDSGELWLSADENPTRVRKIASVAEGSWTSPHDWDRFPSQRSEPIYLESDKSYYVEAFQEQAQGDDHLSVAWEGPGISRSIIPGKCLTPWTSKVEADLAGGVVPGSTNGVFCEYWTNYAAGGLTPVTPVGPADTVMAGVGATFQVVGPGKHPEPLAIDLSDLLLPENNFRWIQAEGIVTFVSNEGPGATLELAAGARRVAVRIGQWNQGPLQPGETWHMQVEGVCEGVTDPSGDQFVGFIWVPTSEDVRRLELADNGKEPLAPPAFPPANSADTFGGYYAVRGAVTFDGRLFGRRYLFVQDIHGSGGVCVTDADRVFQRPLEVGQRIQVGGALSAGQVGLKLVPITMRLLGWASLPLATGAEKDSEYRDGQWTEVEGVVRSVRTNGIFRVQVSDSIISVWSPGMSVDDSLVDCAMRMRGVISLDALDEPLLLVGSQRFVQIEERGPKNPFSLPVTRISDLDRFQPVAPRVHQVKIEATVTYADEGAAFFQDNSGAVRVQPHPDSIVRPGDRFEVVGFPDVRGSVRTLAEARFRPVGVGTPVQPGELDLRDAFAEGRNGRLVRLRGELLAQKIQGSHRILELRSGQRAFEAVLASTDRNLSFLTVGSLLELTGVCVANLVPAPNLEPANLENPAITSVQILLRSPADVAVLRGPPWWTPMKVIVLVSFLVAVLGGTLLWVQLLGRRYERRQMAQLEFSRQILQSQETERRRIAANLHDSLGQNLLVIKNQVRLAMQPTLDREALSKRLDEISGMASQVIEEVRQVTHDLRPYQLERVGLTQSLRRSIQQASENSPIAFATDVDDVDGLFDNEGEIHIYRILQEALNNVVKHSGATEATALVRREASSVFISVRDNGRGLDSDVANGTELPRAGFGLSGIKERARILRGKAIFDSSPAQGFRLSVEIPLPLKHDT
jgi:signal transduction histidine kinase